MLKVIVNFEHISWSIVGSSPLAAAMFLFVEDIFEIPGKYVD